MRVVIDTNVLASSALSPRGNPARLFHLWFEEAAFALLVSAPILEEYRRALRYPRVAARHGLSEEEMTALVDGIAESAILVEPQEQLQVVVDDPKDDKFLECAVAGGADFIVSGDEHLLDINAYRGIQILQPAAFVALLLQEMDGDV